MTSDETEHGPTSGCSYPDTFTGRLRAYSDAWRDHVPSNGAIAEGPDYGSPYLSWPDLDAALTEIVQLERRLDNRRFEAEATGPVGIMCTPFAERTEAIRAHWMEFGFSGQTDRDRERDQVIGHLLDREETLREQLAAATARAEMAEAAYHRLDSAQAAAGSYAGRAEAAEAEVARLRTANKTSADEYDAALLAIHEARDHWQERAAAEFERAEQAEAERDQLRARLAEIGDPTPQYGLRYGRLEPQPISDGDVAFYRAKGHVGFVVRDVRRTGWRSAVDAPHADLERADGKQGDGEGDGDA